MAIPGKRIKILHVVHQMAFGGMEMRIRRLAAGLPRAGFEVHVASLRPVETASLALPEGCRAYFHPIPPGLHPLRLLALARLIRAGRYDFVHTHNWSSMFYGVLAARLALRPRVLHGEHGLNFGDLGKPPPRKRRLAQWLLARLAHRIVAVNPVIAGYVETWWGMRPPRVVVLPNGVDLSRFRALAPGPGAESAVVFGTVARLAKVKNLDGLLRGFAVFRRNHPGRPARLVLVGEGEERADLEALAQSLRVAGEVEFAGEHADVENWYPRFSVFVNSSHYEGMSNTLLEAMASGLPLLASRVEGNTGWLAEGRDALLFAPGDPDELARRMAEFASDPELRRRMGQANRDRVEREFDNKLFLTRYADLYRSFAG
jgi:glycosyltransferase involved in cell wall biosynthesis